MFLIDLAHLFQRNWIKATKNSDSFSLRAKSRNLSAISNLRFSIVYINKMLSTGCVSACQTLSSGMSGWMFDLLSAAFFLHPLHLWLSPWFSACSKPASLFRLKALYIMLEKVKVTVSSGLVRVWWEVLYVLYFKLF